MASPTDVVLAGTKAFALALFAPLTERLGTRPRIAPDPQQALALCAASTGLLVVECGPAWLPALTQLGRQAAGLRIVAALPAGQEAAALALEPLGIEVVPWEGQPGPVLEAVGRALAPAGAAAAPPPPPAAPAAPRLAVTPVRGTPPIASPPVEPPPPAPRVAVTPVLGTPPVAGPPTAAQPAAAPLPAQGLLRDDLFDELEEAAPIEPAAAPERQALAPYLKAHVAEPAAAGARRPAEDWPAGGPTEEEAEAALVLYVRGRLRPEAPLAAVTRQSVATMSELERQVIGGAADLPFDTQPIYRAAVLRLRVAAAVATAPEPPARVDDEAVQRLMAELDVVLSMVNPLAQGAPTDHQPALEAVRNALIREAVDFSELIHRIGAGGPPAATSAQAQLAPVAGTRVLSVQAGGAPEAPEDRRRKGPLLALVVLLVAIAGVLAWQRLSKPPVQAPRTYQGAPANTMAVESGPHRLLVATPGKQVDPADLERFRRQEEQKGNVVTEVAPGNWLIEPARPAGKEGTP